MGRIYWLASYPKSGNTWLRVFLTNYWRNDKQPAEINHLDASPIASDRRLFDEWVGVEASNLTPEEIDRYRPCVYEQLSNHSKENLFLKVHDAFTHNIDGKPIFSKTATKGVIYLVRNPLDVAVSYAYHSKQSISKMVDILCKADQALVNDRLRIHDQFRQTLLSWSLHVESWVNEPGINCLIVRYEDMSFDPDATFSKIVHFLGLEIDSIRIRKSIDFSRFEQLKDQEMQVGFREKFDLSALFFRKGKVGAWRDVLSNEHVDQLISAHRSVMIRFGYLNETGELTY